MASDPVNRLRHNCDTITIRYRYSRVRSMVRRLVGHSYSELLARFAKKSSAHTLSVALGVDFRKMLVIGTRQNVTIDQLKHASRSVHISS